MSPTHDTQHVSPPPAGISLHERLLRLDVTSSAEATTLAERGQRSTYRDLALAPFSAFVRVYLRQGKWRYGVSGLIAAVFTAYGVFVCYTKLWEQQNVKTTVPPSPQS